MNKFSKFIPTLCHPKYNQFMANLADCSKDASLLSKYCLPEVFYEEVKDMPNHPEKLLIDVRTQQEISEAGSIPTAINIPVDCVKDCLGPSTSNEKFRSLFERDKPTVTTPIIVTCRLGRRAINASEMIYELGYRNIKIYKGSWSDWAKREGIEDNEKK